MVFVALYLRELVVTGRKYCHPLIYTIVIGAGDIGTPLIRIATAGGNDVVVVEREEQRADEARLTYDVLIINVDATIREA